MKLINTIRRTLLKVGVLSLTVILSGGLSALAYATDSIKIGYVSPQTGPLAGFGEADDYVIDSIREQFKDGLKIGDETYQIEIIVKDSQSNPNRAADVASELILKDEVDMILVSSTPETTNPVSDQCEVNEIPCISTVAPWQPWFFCPWR